jgi:predicted ferric reductase
VSIHARAPEAAELLLVAIGAGAVAITAMWFVHTPPLLGAGDYLTAVGRLTGLMAGYSATVLIALMARVPAVERGVGADRAARWHARAGRYMLGLLVCHVLTITWGYALAAHTTVPHEISVLFSTYPDILTAVIAGGLILGVGVVSASRVRPSLRYEVWYLTHLTTYAAVALALGHQLADGADFVYYPVERFLWTLLFAVMAALVVAYRLVTPLHQAVRQRMMVTAVDLQPGEVLAITVCGRHVEELNAEAGQFFRLRFLSSGLCWQSHPFSLSAVPDGPNLRFAVKMLGDYSRALQGLQPGTAVVAEGPYGALTARRRRRAKVLLVAGGIGIAPLRALFESIPAGAAELSLLYRCRSETDLALRAELDVVAAARRARVHYVLGRTKELGDPLGPEALIQRFPDIRDYDIFICGPSTMTAWTAASLRRLGVPRRQVHSESFELGNGPLSGLQRAATGLCTTAVVVALLTMRTGNAAQAHRLVAQGPANDLLSSAGGRGARPSSAGPRTVMGPAVRTLYSTVQVEVTVRQGRLTDVRAVALPNLDAHSRQLSAVAAPILRREALRAGNAHIHMVSGATYTSDAYAQSLQGALDQARS